MARIRSPNYPAISLSEAIQRIKLVHDQEHHLPADKEVIAKHLGYSGLNGASLKVISAMGKYGLLEDIGDKQARVSPLAISILFPENESKKADALREAGTKPALFAEMLEQWDGHIPSDASIRSYLVRRNFAQSAIDTVIQSFRETIALVTPESGSYESPPTQKPTAKEFKPLQPTTHSTHTMTPPVAPGMRISLVDDRLEGTFSLRDPKDVDKLIKALQANKVLLEPILEPFATEYTGDEVGQETERRDRDTDEMLK